MEDIVLNFEDFLKPSKEKKIEEPKIEEPKIEEAIRIEEPKIEEDIKIETIPPIEKIVESHIEQDKIQEKLIVEEVESDKYYTLYRDKSEEFSCDVDIEGSREEATARLIVETKDWTLLFPGTISDGKCNIPIKKLNIFEEGQKGTIKLEVIVEGTVFVPWEDEFKIKLSKKVNVSFNENKKSPFKPNKSPEIDVKVTMK